MTVAPKLTITDGDIDWNQPAAAVHAMIRGTTPEPGAFTTIDNARLKVLEAAVARDLARMRPGEVQFLDKTVLVGTATDALRLILVHPAGRTAMDAASWWRGRGGSTAFATMTTEADS